jgi:hypothetical protein
VVTPNGKVNCPSPRDDHGRRRARVDARRRRGRGREFAKGLKIGDTVQLDYTEVVAMAIEKV